MIRKILGIIIVSGIFATVTSGVCRAGESGGELLSKWRNEHRHHVITLVQNYLRGENSAMQKRQIKEIVRLEVLMGTCSKSQNDFYLDKVDPDNLEQLPGQMLMIYLENKGVTLNARKFFEGKRISYYPKKGEEL